MRSALRYAVSVAIGLVVAVVVARLATGGWLVTVTLCPLYAVASSLVLAHRRRWARSRDDPTPTAGAAIGGAAALTGGALLQASVPAATAGFGLLFLGMAGAVALLDEP